MLFLFDNFSLDCRRRELRCAGTIRAVEPQVFDLLEYLVRNRDRVVTRDDLISAVWNGRIVSDATLASRISSARNAVGDNGEDQRLIRTILRKGIRFVGEVREQAEADAPSRGGSEQAPALPDKPSIAVLPFANISEDSDQDYFADGMAEEIITGLSHCKSLFVIARNSSFTYKGKAVDIRQVGRELGVRYVLEGSVRRSGNRIRFTAQLIESASGSHVWADRFDGELNDVFKLQDQITENVVAVIEPNVQLAEIERLKQKQTTNLDAYDSLLHAQQLQYEFTRQSIAEAIDFANRALTIDPRCATAIALAAYCHAERNFQGWSDDPAAEAAEGVRLVGRALECDKNDANVLWMAAHVTLRLVADVQRASELIYRSLAFNPNSAIALTVASLIETHAGNAGQALELARRARRLNPRDPREWYIDSIIALAHFAADQYDECASWAERALALNPHHAGAQWQLAASLVKVGKIEAAAAVVKRMRQEHDITISKLRTRLSFMNERLWKELSHGLRVAGLPE